MKKKYCIIGLGKIGENLLYSLDKKKFNFDFWDQNISKANAIGKKIKKKPISNINLYLKENSVCIMLFIPHDKVESFLTKKIIFLKKNDIVIDFGNSNPSDTKTRYDKLKKKKILFFGIGFSGGVEGARKKPCLMISGKKTDIEKIRKIINTLLNIRCKKKFLVVGDSPEAGHFAKICHNAIEYSIMQILSEFFLLNKKILNQNDGELIRSFEKLNKLIPQFYLGNISEKIVKNISLKTININCISDKVDHNNTSKWYNLLCLENNISCPNLLSSFENRILSKSKKNIANKKKILKKKKIVSKNIEALFKFLFVLCYLQGIFSLRKLCKIKKIKINFKNVIKVWQFNSIISSNILRLKQIETLDQIVDHFSQKKISQYTKMLNNLIKVFLYYDYNPAGLYSSYNLLSSHLNKKNIDNSFIQVQRNIFGNHKLGKN